MYLASCMSSKDAYVFPIISLWELQITGRGQFGPQGLIGTIYVGDI